MTPFNEQREAIRFLLRCPVEFEQGNGWSCDISTIGMYFLTTRLLYLSETIELVIRPEHSPAIYCNTQVGRTDKEAQGYGIAVCFTAITIDSATIASA
jgi:hypothetical protein